MPLARADGRLPAFSVQRDGSLPKYGFLHGSTLRRCCLPSAAGTSARREFLEARPVGSFDRVPGVPPTAMWLLHRLPIALAKQTRSARRYENRRAEPT